MTTHSAVVLTAVAVCLGTLAWAQPAEPPKPPLENWTAPPYWTPPAAEQARQHPIAAQPTGEHNVTTESAPAVTILPFTAVTPCRLIDTRHGPKDVYEPGDVEPSGYPRGSYASGEIRSYDLTLSACTGLPAGVGAWSLQFQFVTTTQAAFLESWPYVSGLGIGAQVVPTAQSTMLGYTDRWTAMSAIIPAGDDADGSIDVYAQYAGDVIVQVNGYYAAQPVVTSVSGNVGVTKLTGDLGIVGGTGISVTDNASNTITVSATVPQGPTGPTGPTGATGPTGPMGVTGLIGPTGATGATGSTTTPDLARVALLNWWGGPYSGGSYGFASPQGVAFDGTHIWVTNYANSVTEINASDGSWVQTLSGGSYGFNGPYGVAFDGTHIWVTNYYGNSVTEINASDGSWVRTLSGGSYGFAHPRGVAFDGTHIWVTNSSSLSNGNSVVEISASDGSWVRTLSGGTYGFGSPSGVAFDGTHVWVTNLTGNSVTEIKASDGSLVQTLSDASYGFGGPWGVAFDGTYVWVANSTGNSVTEIKASDGSWMLTLYGDPYWFNAPIGVAFDGAHIWVTNRDQNFVSEINPSNWSLMQDFSGPLYGFNGPTAVAFDGTHTWVANSTGNSVSEILVK